MYNSSQLALGALPFRLTTTQVAQFLARHPIIATQVAETEAVMKFGLYDYDYNPALQWKLPGVIPPWGTQVQDSVFGIVTVFPARSGDWYYTGSSPELHTDNPPYVSPKGPCPDGYVDVAGLCIPKPPSLNSIAMYALVGFVAYAVITRGGK
jgi:hypothetical protein